MNEIVLDEEINFSYLINLFKKYFSVILVAFAIFLAMLVVYANSTKNNYLSRTTVYATTLAEVEKK